MILHVILALVEQQKIVILVNQLVIDSYTTENVLPHAQTVIMQIQLIIPVNNVMILVTLVMVQVQITVNLVKIASGNLQPKLVY